MLLSRVWREIEYTDVKSFPELGRQTRGGIHRWSNYIQYERVDKQCRLAGRSISHHHRTDFFQSVARQRLLYLKTQRNLTCDEADVRKRSIARHRFEQLIPKYCIDDGGPFKVFCDAMQPANMLLDPSTL